MCLLPGKVLERLSDHANVCFCFRTASDSAVLGAEDFYQNERGTNRNRPNPPCAASRLPTAGTTFQLPRFIPVCLDLRPLCVCAARARGREKGFLRSDCDVKWPLCRLHSDCVWRTSERRTGAEEKAARPGLRSRRACSPAAACGSS